MEVLFLGNPLYPNLNYHSKIDFPCIDGEQIASDTNQGTQATSLYFSLGRPWMETRSGKYGEIWLDKITVDSSIPIPEPSSLLLFGVGILGLLGYGWRRRNSPGHGHL